MHQWFNRCALLRHTADGIMSSSILVVEDEKTALHSLSSLLADEGYTVLQAERGEQGLRLAMRQEPDLILLDIRHTDLDPLRLLARLRADQSDDAVLIMPAA